MITSPCLTVPLTATSSLLVSTSPPQMQLMSSWYQQIYTEFLYTEAVSAYGREQTYELMDLCKHARRGEFDGLVLPGMETRSVTLPQSCSVMDHDDTFPHSHTKIMKNSNLPCLLLNISGNIFGQYTGLERQGWSIKENQDRDVFGHVATNKIRLEI